MCITGNNTEKEVKDKKLDIRKGIHNNSDIIVLKLQMNKNTKCIAIHGNTCITSNNTETSQ